MMKEFDLSKFYPYDIETYKNCFTMYIGNAETRECWSFEISDRKNQRKEMIELMKRLRSEGSFMVGFNNLGFDYPVLHQIFKNSWMQARDIFDYAQQVINASDEEKFDYLIPWHKQMIKQIDLYKIHHFDNKARSTSLKMLEFNMRSNTIEELPYSIDKELSSEEIDNLLAYNKKDLKETDQFFTKSIDKIKLRINLSNKYDKNFMNHNDTKIGKDFFIMRLEEEKPNSCFGKNKKPKQTKRKSIDLNDCILDYIEFDRPEFRAVQDWLSKQTITETKGVFNDIPEHNLGDLANYCEMRVIKKKMNGTPDDPQPKEIQKIMEDYPMYFIEERELKSKKQNSFYVCYRVAENLNCLVDGLRYDFGTGGLHASVESSIIRSTDEKIVVDKDVQSYYPNVVIKNDLKPQHLGDTFAEIYNDVYTERKQYPKGSGENMAMKLALNGVYGDSNNQYSPFYDPKLTMTITINGQLSLCMLAEKLLEVDTLEMIQCNTDGLTYRVDRQYKEQANQVCREWEKVTKLELEDDDYELMAIRDVNNYLAKSFSGKVKNKGAYEYQDLDWNKNFSNLVVPMAAEQAILNNTDVAYFINNHNDEMDFMSRTKVPRYSRLVVVDRDDAGDICNERRLQNITRYYISDNPDGELFKIMPPLPDKDGKLYRHPETQDEVKASKKSDFNKLQKQGYECVGDTKIPQEERWIGVESGWGVKVCNDIESLDDDIDYSYYIREARKLVDILKEYDS